MKHLQWSRRQMLGLGAGLAVGSALRGLRAEAQTAQIPKRIVLFFTPHGTIWPQWRPTGTTTQFTLPYILNPLASLQSKLVVVDGVGLPDGGPGAAHTRGPAVLFTGSPLASDNTFTRGDCSGGCTFGWNTSASVDQIIAQRLGKATPYGSLEFGVQNGGGHPGNYISYAAAAQPLSPFQDPYVAFQQLFAGLQGTTAEQARTLTRRRNVLSAVKADLASVQNRVTTADYQRLQAHADAIAQLEQSLGAGAGCTLPPNPGSRAPSSPGFRPWALDRHSDLLAASLACGLTRVGSIMFRPGENDGGPEGIYDWLGQTSEHHLATHDGGSAAVAQVTEIYRWYAQRFAYLLAKLDSYPESDGGTLLDHTLVVWGSELGNGLTHDHTNVPFVLAGGGKAGMATGRYLKLPTGTMNHRLLVSMCHFMGYTDIQKVGSLDTGSGPLTGLS